MYPYLSVSPTCMILKMRVISLKLYSIENWICPTFSVGSDVSIYMSTRLRDRFWKNAICGG